MQRTFPLTVSLILIAMSGCTEPGETTTISAATGGAIGAGLGAIIGSQTGDPGAGLVIGAAAGAGTGALVGNAIEGQDRKLRTQEEAITRQENTIAAQRRELDELRRMNDTRADGGTSRGYPSGHMTRNSPQSFRSPPYNSPASRDSSGMARGTPPHTFSSQGTTTARSNTSMEAMHTSRAASAPHNAQPAYAAGRSPETRGTLDWSTTKSQHEEPVQAATLRENEARAAELADVTQENSTTGAMAADALDAESAGTFGTTAKVAPATSECREAEQEVRKAVAASEAPDKLFHYRRALRLCPTNPAYHNSIGEVYLGLNRKVDAEFEFREALQIDPDFESAQRNLDLISSGGGQRDTY